MNAPTVTVTRTFDVPPEQVFDAWLDPAALGRWMFGPTVRHERVEHIRTDPRVGGRFSFAVQRNGEPIDHVGEYRAIDRPARLAFSWGIAGASTSEVRVTVDAAPGGSTLTLVHTLDPAWAAAADRTRDGWAFMFETLDRELHPADGRAHSSGPGTLRLERMLAGPVERVWDHLTDPDLRSRWLAGGPMEPRVGGAVELVFDDTRLSDVSVPAAPSHHVVHGRVTDLLPPERLAFTWGRSAVAFALRPQGTQVRLTVTHSGLPDDAASRSAACAWHAHADTLADLLQGHTREAFATRHAALTALYHQREHNG